MEGNEEYEERVDVKDILPLEIESQEEKFVICGDYIDNILPGEELPRPSAVNKRHHIERRCSIVNNTEKINEFMVVWSDAMTKAVEDKVKIEPEETIFDESYETENLHEENEDNPDEADSFTAKVHKNNTSKNSYNLKRLLLTSPALPKYNSTKSLNNKINTRSENDTQPNTKSKRKIDHLASKTSENSLTIERNLESPTPPLTKNKSTRSNTRSEKHNTNYSEKGLSAFFWLCCRTEFDDFEEYTLHKLQKHNISEYHCSVCPDSVFTSLSEVQTHYENTHCKALSTSFTCFHCKIVFGVQSSFFQHKQLCNKPKHVCDQILNSIIDYAVTRKQQEGRSKKNNYYMVCCEKVISTFQEFTLHKFVEHKIEHMVCGLCFSEEMSMMALHKHYLQFHFLNIDVDFKRSKQKSDVDIASTSGETKKTDECSSGIEGDLSFEVIKCTAQQDGILCQCTTCTAIIRTFLPSNDTDETDEKALAKPYACKICNLRVSVPVILIMQILKLNTHQTHAK